jgi:hypothetical protein
MNFQLLEPQTQVVAVVVHAEITVMEPMVVRA